MRGKSYVLRCFWLKKLKKYIIIYMMGKYAVKAAAQLTTTLNFERWRLRYKVL